MLTICPLAWPDGWPRTPPADRHSGDGHFLNRRVRGRLPAWTFGTARDALAIELDHLGARNVSLCINIALGADGRPLEAAAGEDPGVAIYFEMDGIMLVIACDRHGRAESNMQAIVRTLDTLRQLERQGGRAMLDRALAGFRAPGGPRTCWTVLGLSAGATLVDIQRAYHAKARQAHPDSGGSDAAMAELNRARDEAIRVAR